MAQLVARSVRDAEVGGSSPPTPTKCHSLPAVRDVLLFLAENGVQLFIMLAVISCLAGVVVLLGVGEFLWKSKIISTELMRKFVHLSVATFVAFWPWLLSWRTIEIISACMIVVVLSNRFVGFFHYSTKRKSNDYGDLFLALAFLACAELTSVKIFFAVAILQVALSDSLAALIGQNYGKRWRYKAFGQPKTVVGSMVFWLTSLCVLAVTVLFGGHNLVSYEDYALLLVALPPILTAVENVSNFGVDNLSVPLVTLLALQLVQIH